MKVHRIITTIEVENDNSITSVELTNLHPTNNDIPLAVTNITTQLWQAVWTRYHSIRGLHLLLY
jgi:hypothetical protein